MRRSEASCESRAVTGSTCFTALLLMAVKTNSTLPPYCLNFFSRPFIRSVNIHTTGSSCLFFKTYICIHCHHHLSWNDPCFYFMEFNGSCKSPLWNYTEFLGSPTDLHLHHTNRESRHGLRSPTTEESSGVKTLFLFQILFLPQSFTRGFQGCQKAHTS